MGRQSLFFSHSRRLLRSSSSAPHFFSQNPTLCSSSFASLHSILGRRISPQPDGNFYISSNPIAVRSFSFNASSRGPEIDDSKHVEASATEAELFDLGFHGSEVADGGVSESWLYTPVRLVISLLDGYHDLTNFPWWIIITTSTLALRLTILPVLILQLKKLQRMSELLPKLPPPLPPPLSGRSFREQYLLFRKERKAVGCPSQLWSFAPFFVQAPCFILWMMSVRRMSLDHHVGFDTGGMLWFQNLTEFPHGALGPIFPILIATLHYINVQVSFQGSAVRNFPGILGLLAKYYKIYLDILTLPILLIGFCVPHGSLLYWVTNSSLSLVQQLSLKNPNILHKFGLPPKHVTLKRENSEGNLPTGEKIHPLSLKHPYILEKLGLQTKHVEVEHQKSAEDLPPDELLDLGLQHLAAGNQDKALPLLRLAAEKDSELARASIALGLFLFSRGLLTEASEHFENAISKVKDDEITQLIIASFGAGISLLSQQGRTSEGIQHLKRIAELKEPENPMDKFCYYQGLVMLGSTLFNEGQKAEAVKYLRIAAEYDPAVNKYIKECEMDEKTS
ncbi:hypothetical protein AAC387_Pa06g1924 [Persea americana]